MKKVESKKQIQSYNNVINKLMEQRKDEIYDYLIDYGIATEEEISLVCSINGTNEDSLNSILYSRTGYRDIEQIKEEEEYDK